MPEVKKEAEQTATSETKVEETKKLTLVQKLAKIQLELKAPKNQRNKFGNYNYRSAEDILEAVKPLAVKYGAVVRVTDDVMFVPCKTSHVQKTTDGEFVDESDGRIYIKATVCLHDCDTPDVITTSAMAREEEQKKGMDSSQVTGADSSYARKYALNGMFAIDDTKDSDATNDHVKGQPVPQKTAEQVLQHQPQHNLKFKEAWALYCKAPQNEGVDRKVMGETFKKTCIEITGNADVTKLADADWNKVIDFINVLTNGDAK